jgi:hypothetical protein
MSPPASSEIFAGIVTANQRITDKLQYTANSIELKVVTLNTHEAQNRSGCKDNFFSALRYVFSRFLHENCSAFILFVWGDEPDG